LAVVRLKYFGDGATYVELQQVMGCHGEWMMRTMSKLMVIRAMMPTMAMMMRVLMMMMRVLMMTMRVLMMTMRVLM